MNAGFLLLKQPNKMFFELSCLSYLSFVFMTHVTVVTHPENFIYIQIKKGEKTMQENTKKVKIIQELEGAHGVAYIEFRDLMKNKVSILQVANFYRRYGVKDGK